VPRISRRAFAQGAIAGLLRWAGIPVPAIASAQPAAGVLIIADSKPAATLVTPDKPKASVRYATEELAWHIERATGSRPLVSTESAVSPASDAGTLIFLGDTSFAREAGLAIDALALETSNIKTVGEHLCIAGADGSGDPLDRNTSAGTLFGVYEFLERYLAVRWLWPGKLGTFVPKAESVVIPPVDLVVAPRLVQRHVRGGAGFKSKEHPELGFTAAAADEYMQAQTVFLRRHRMGRRWRMSYGHAFGDWWDKYGTEHPEWFQLVNGKRGPVKPGARFSMCISDPSLHEEIVVQWRQHGGGKHGQTLSFVNAVENDIPGLCQCDICTALDGPEPADYRDFISPKSKIAKLPLVSDRYARSWLAIQQIAAKYDPNAIVVGYAYFNYFAAPTSGVKLGENVLIGFCPSSWGLPRSDEEHAWLKAQWRGWADTGARLFMRTNYFLAGYCMPYIFAHQFADEFENAAQNRLIGTDFDSLTGQWATQGPTLYLLMRLQARPEMDADTLLAEYYSAFGPAAADVKAYFDHWEEYTSAERSNYNDALAAFGASGWRSAAKIAHVAYPQQSFAQGETLLAKAADAAASDPEATERVKFLQLGLEHARLCALAASRLTLGNATATPEAGKAELEALLAFRHTHERAWVESQSWALPGPAVETPDPDAD